MENFNSKNIILRLRQAENKYTEARRIKEELARLSYSKREEIRSELRRDKVKSDNSDLIDVINDILSE